LPGTAWPASARDVDARKPGDVPRSFDEDVEGTELDYVIIASDESFMSVMAWVASVTVTAGSLDVRFFTLIQ
jgi:hypothetical protein